MVVSSKREHLLFLDRASGAMNQAMDVSKKSNRKVDLKGVGLFHSTKLNVAALGLQVSAITNQKKKGVDE